MDGSYRPKPQGARPSYSSHSVSRTAPRPMPMIPAAVMARPIATTSLNKNGRIQDRLALVAPNVLEHACAIDFRRMQVEHSLQRPRAGLGSRLVGTNFRLER